jgi:hypothetical protein
MRTRADITNSENLLACHLAACQGGVPPHLRSCSTYATRLSAAGVADEWVTQMLRQGDALVFKKYSQMKLQMKREALEKLNRRANEMSAEKARDRIGTVSVQ